MTLPPTYPTRLGRQPRPGILEVLDEDLPKVV